MSALEHVTITSGGARTSPRDEVADHVVETLRAALAGDGDVGGGWQVRLLRAPAGGHVYDLVHRGRHVVRCWLCVDVAVAPVMWRAAAASGLDPHARLIAPRAVPWLAVSLTVEGITVGVTDPQMLYEAGDLERCVAWAILE